MAATILHTSNGKLDPVDQAQLAQLSPRLGGATVLLHLHGGLVDNDHGEAIARRLAGTVAAGGFGLPASVEQVFVVWRTGALETLKTNWTDLFDNDRLYKTLLKKVLSFAASKLGVPADIAGRSAFSVMALTPSEIAARLEARGPGDPFGDVDLVLEVQVPGGRGATVQPETDGALALQFSAILSQDLEFNLAADNLAAALTFDPAAGRALAPRGDPDAGQASLERLDPAIRAELGAATPAAPTARALFSGFQVAQFLIKRAISVAIRVIRRFRTHRDHGFYATVVEEITREFYGDLIGAAIWGMMKTDAADHFAPGGLGHDLVMALAASPPQKLWVTAHSAGAIWAAELLKAVAAQAGLPKIRMALLAPAVRMDLFAEAVAAGGDAVEALRIFTMSDALERADAVLGHDLGFIYPSSLLYLVSGAFEDLKADAFPDAPLLGMQRFLVPNPGWLDDAEQVADVTKVMAYLSRPHNGAVFSPSAAGPGLNCDAASHGDFDQNAATLASVVDFL